MSTLVLTVPHSGTHFIMRYLVGVLGLDAGESLRYFNKDSTCDVCHAHPTPSMMEEFKPSELFDTLILTLRHPHKSTQTGLMGGEDIKAIEDSWRSLLVEKDKYNKTLFLVIDGPEENRFSELMAIAKHFEKEHLEPAIREYAENWTPVNQSITDEEKSAMDFAVQAYEKWQS